MRQRRLAAVSLAAVTLFVVGYACAAAWPPALVTGGPTAAHVADKPAGEEVEGD